MSSYHTKPGTPVDTRYSAFLQGIKLWNVYSQNCEDAIIDAIFRRIGETNRYCFECGAADGLFFSNTKRLIDQGWYAVLVEAEEGDFRRLNDLYLPNNRVYCFQKFIVARPEDEDINAHPQRLTLDNFLAKTSAPKDLDLLIVDIDGADYYLLNSLIQYRPRVIIAEYDPDADPMFIPELNGKGQAGHLALRYVAEARGYEVICRNKTNLICVRKDLAKLLEGPTVEELAKSVKAFAKALGVNERPKDLMPDHLLECGIAYCAPNCPKALVEHWQKESPSFAVSERTLQDAVHQLPPVQQKKQSVQIAAVMSVPRLGYLDTLNQIQNVMAQARAPLGMCYGVFWHHALTRGIEKALAWRTKDGKPADYILTIDYDSYVTLDNLGKLAVLLADNPEVDIVVPMQAKRAGGELLAGTEGPIDLTKPLVPIVTGHFGFTLFKREVFERLNKPWFWEKPAPDGGWGEGRVDPDIGFWRNVTASGCKPYLATQVVVGHGEEVVSWPQLEDGVLTVGYQTVKDWQEERQAAA